MNKKGNNKFKKALFAGSLLLLTNGCSARVTCDNPNNHVHLYKNGIYNPEESEYSDVVIWLWEETKDEVETYKNIYQRTDIMFNITSEDEKYFRFLKDNGLTELNVDTGLCMNFMYKQMLKYSHDSLEYEYEEPVYEKDENGKEYLDHYETGWTTNSKNTDNTGYVRVVHYRFKLSKLMKENGEWKMKTISVDDPQPYFKEYNYFKFPTLVFGGYHLEQKIQYISKRYSYAELQDLDADKLSNFTRVDTTTEGFQKWLKYRNIRTGAYFSDDMEYTTSETLLTLKK